MIILQLQGGLGNQMFICAVYEKLKKMFPDRDIRLDLSHYRYYSEAREIEIKKFPIDICEASEKDVKKILGYNPNDNLTLKGRLTRRFLKKADVTGQEQFNNFLSDNIYLSGYFQSEEYFKDIKDSLKKIFEFKENEDFPEEYKGILLEIQNSHNPVSLHIRRGDYLTLAGHYGGVCTEEYYAKAVNFMLKEKPDASFYVFSDDEEYAIKYCQRLSEKIGETRVKRVPSELLTSGFYDMYLMTNCVDHIIANSSFSWWGAYLSRTEGITVCPNRWFADKNDTSMICDNWIRIV